MSLAYVSATGVCLLCIASVADAHHSRAFYDMTKEVVIEGTVAKLEWMNPHVSLTVRTNGTDGAAFLQDIEVMSVSEARAMGLRPDAIAEGAHVVVRAHPGRSGPGAKAVGIDVRTSDGTRLPLNTDAGFAVTPSGVVEASGIAGRWAPPVADFQAVFPAMFSWPFTEAARANVTAVLAQPTANAALGICADYPPPVLSVFPDLRSIEIGDTTVVMRFEAQGQNEVRLVHLDQTHHPAGVAPSLLGHSIGRWEGKTLVIDTVAFVSHPVGVTLGVVSGPNKHLVERLTLAEDRRHLHYAVTLEDPSALTAPASLNSLWEYRPDLEPTGVACNPGAARRALEH